MKRKLKLLTTIIIIAIGFLILQSNKVNAALQSNGGAVATKDVNGWITQIRQMQATGGTLGLTDTISGNLTSGNKNLDIHMEKNTEYGAMVLLSASAYGNPGKITANGQTTTGNATGVVMNINKEWVAAGTSASKASSMANAAGRYKNVYTATYVEKAGDAIATVGGWHNASGNEWLKTEESNINESCLVRSRTGSIFSYYGYGHGYQFNYGGGSNWYNDGYYTKTWASRAAVVVGSGI